MALACRLEHEVEVVSCRLEGRPLVVEEGRPLVGVEDRPWVGIGKDGESFSMVEVSM